MPVSYTHLDVYKRQVLKRLKDCGWIHEEVGENYEVFITFEDYSIQIMDCLFHLEDVRESEEYSGLIYLSLIHICSN